MQSSKPLLRALAPAARHRLLRPSSPAAVQLNRQRQHRSLTTTRPLRALSSPLNIPSWLNENSHLLQPPVNNYCVYNDEVTVMIVGGPNARTDYHINNTAEWFYQYKGAMLLKTVQDGVFKDVVIKEGDMFLLPPDVPHNPVRFKDTVGVVIEQKRPADSRDTLRWYCQGCESMVHEKSFHCTDLGTQLKAAVEQFEADTDARTCKKCGEVCETRPKKAVELPKT